MTVKALEESKPILSALLANLLDEQKSRLGVMGSYQVTSDMIPSEMVGVQFEREMLEALERCDINQTPPTPENVALYMNPQNYSANLARIQAMRSNASGLSSILPQATYLHRLFLIFKAEAAAKRALEIAQSGRDAVSAHQEMLQVIMDARPEAKNESSFNRESQIDLFLEKQKKRVERAKLGQALGAVLPFAGLRRLAPVLEAGDVTLITAPPKTGKTMTAMEAARYNAYENSADVLLILTETHPSIIEERFVSSALLIPSKALRTGAVDLHASPWRERYSEYKEKVRHLEQAKGRIWTEYHPGINIAKIRSLIGQYKRRSDAAGRPLLVIIDYLQRIHKGKAQSDVEGLAHVSHAIKDAAGEFGVHVILFSQEAFNKVEKKESRAFGSNTPLMVAQLHICIRRERSSVTIPIQDGNGAQMYDALGRERYWQKAGDRQWQTVVCYEILMANMDEVGPAYVAVENGLFRFVDIGLKYKPNATNPWEDIPQFMQNQIWAFEHE